MTSSGGSEGLKRRTVQAIQKAHQDEADGHQSLVKRVERCDSVFRAVLSLQTDSVESDVPVGHLGNEFDRAWANSVKSVGCEGVGALGFQ